MTFTMDLQKGILHINSDLTYDLRQIAVFGEATYTFFDRLGVTAGLRWYDWEEDKTFKSGGAFSNLEEQNQNVTVSSNGLTPRFMVSYDVTDHVAVNAQASRGFRLGGYNDPLNRGLCGLATMRPTEVPAVSRRDLWNYEVGVKSSFERVTLNGSLFYADIDNLGVNVDAGSCSSRVAINVPEAHTMGGELELSVHPTDALLVTFAGSYVEAEFDSTVRTQRDLMGRVPKGPWSTASRRQPHPVRAQLAALRGGDVHVPGSPAVKGKLHHRLLAVRRRSDHPIR